MKFKKVLLFIFMLISLFTISSCKGKDDNVEKENYTVKFFIDTNNTVTMEYEENTVLTEEKVLNDVFNNVAPTKEGYTTDLLWYSNSNYTTWVELPITITSDLTLYLEWISTKAPVQLYTVKFDGASLSNKMVEAGSTISKPADPTKANHTFDGWFADAEFTTAFDFSTPITKDTTIYAKWTEIEATPTVTFDSVGGSDVTAQTVANGNRILEPEAPTKEGYTFLGWYLDSEYKLTFSFSTKITKSMTIYARWKSNDAMDEAFVSEDEVSGDNEVYLLEYGSYQEGAYIEFKEITNATYKISYKKTAAADYIQIDADLIRNNKGTIRADIVGLSAGAYDIKIEAGSHSKEIENLIVTSHDRSGYAHFDNNEGVGAYNNDGTLKNNAVVVYVNDKTKNTVTATIAGTKYTGLCEIIKAQKNASNPLVVRIIGRISTASWSSISYGEEGIKGFSADKITDYNGKKLPKQNFTEEEILSGNHNVLVTRNVTKLNGLSNRIKYSSNEFDSYFNMLDVADAKNITLEGIGEDAEIFQWGVTWKKCNSIEVRNLTFTDYPEDACSFEGSGNDNVDGYGNYWVHNNVFNRGKNNWDVTYEQDKHYGDGATDFKNCFGVTSSYNVFNYCKKTGLVGGSNSTLTKSVTFHHNFYNEVGARLPLGRQANMHIYNNYYYKCTTAQDIRANAFVLSEQNYFEGCDVPQKISISKEYPGTVIKSYNDYLTGCGVSNATIVTDRTTTLSGACKPDGENDYTNFDINEKLFYYDSTNEKSDVSVMTDVMNVKAYNKKYAGITAKNVIYAGANPSSEDDIVVEPTKYTVSFSGATISAQTIVSGAKATEPNAPEKTGFTFGGWYTDQACTQAFNFNTPITSSITLYAKWTENTTNDDNTGDDNTGNEDTVEISLTSYGSYQEGAFVEFDELQDASTYNVYYKKTAASDYIKIDAELIRSNNGSYRADIVGLSAGAYDIKIEAGSVSKVIENLVVTSQDRSGYAHFNNSTGVGAYNNDGTLKANAIVVYVTNKTKNTVTVTSGGNTYTGLVNILQNKKNITNPLVIRVLDSIKTNQWKAKSEAPRLTDDSNLSSTFWTNEFETTQGENLVGLKVMYMDKKSGVSYSYTTTKTGLSSVTTGSTSAKTTTYKGSEYSSLYGSTVYDDDSYFNMLDIQNASNVTLEGIGTEAEFFQWGITWKLCNSIEVKNIEFTDYTEDACSFEGSKNTVTYGNYWVHNNIFNKGKNNWDVSGERDKYAGDGATDFKYVYGITSAYNVFNSCKKTGLVGGSDSDYTKDVTFHHNYYNKVGSRLPLGRQANMHIYNNYYYDCGTALDIRANAFVLSESNYFYSCEAPQKADSAVIKSYNDYLTECGSSAATVVSSRTATVSGTCKPDGSTNYANFDTNSELFYYDETNQKSNVTVMTAVSEVPTYVQKYAGFLANNIINSNGNVTVPDNSGDDNESGDNTGNNENTNEPIVITFDNAAASYTASTEYNGLTINATSEKTVTTATSTATNVECSKMLALGGGGTAEHRNIEFTLTKAANVTIMYNGNLSSGSGRILHLYDSSFTSISQANPTDASTTTALTFTNSNLEAGTYYIASASGGINIYSIKIEYID